jgi:hypothetical protein
LAKEGVLWGFYRNILSQGETLPKNSKLFPKNSALKPHINTIISSMRTPWQCAIKKMLEVKFNENVLQRENPSQNSDLLKNHKNLLMVASRREVSTDHLNKIGVEESIVDVAFVLSRLLNSTVCHNVSTEKRL